MKVISTFCLLAVAPAAMAHTGDHTALTSSLTHAFSSADHLLAATAVLGAVGAAFALTAKFNTRCAARRAK